MPIGNDQNKEWTGWLIDDLGSSLEDVRSAIVAAINARKIPKSKVSTGTVNMWFRGNSLYIDATCSLDGTINATIHIQEYGTSTWIGRAVEAYSTYNYYKRMAASAFVWTIDECIREAILTISNADAVRDVGDSIRR